MKPRGLMRWLILVAFLAAGLTTFIFSYRACQHAQHWQKHVDETIQPWMNVAYIAHSYHVDQAVIYSALKLPLNPPDKRPLKTIAHYQHRPVADLIKAVKAAIEDARASASPSENPSP